MYAKYIKRPIDFLLSLAAFIVLFPFLLVFTVIGFILMKGNPFFTQPRPGKDEKIFKMIKFRTMTNDTDENGNLLPDYMRLTRYGRFLRATSIDELPELLNILKGDMAIIGPRPQLVRDMVFMSETQRLRHTVRPGLSGLAQINGRNAINWDNKLSFDLEYIENITFCQDMSIIFRTLCKVLKPSEEVAGEIEIVEDFGDYLLRKGKVTREEYDKNMTQAKELIKV